MEFMGYRRPNGTVGTRNHVLILPSVVCANQVVRAIARNVAGTVWVEHPHGCSQLAPDAAQTERTLVGHGAHPNVFGVVVVGLGCETVMSQSVTAKIKELCPDKPVVNVVIQDCGGSFNAIAEGSKAAQKMIQQASLITREPIDISELILGTECGGSDACSGISGNPALGEASDLLIDAGGAVILAETPELIGAEHIVAARAVTPEIAKRCYEVIDHCEAEIKRLGVDLRGGNPSQGNQEGGLTTIEEKSLGCVHKGGTKPLQDVIDYAMPVNKKGLIWMDTPGNDIEQMTGMVAGGCQIVVFTTGRGTPTGSAIVPTIKLATNTPMYEKMKDNMDMNAGTIVTGDETVKEVGKRILEEMIEVASGKLTKSEILGHNDFSINRIGPTT